MKYKCLVIFVVLSAISVTLQAQEDIKVEFEAPGLKRAIRKAIDKPSGVIYASELKEIKELDAEDYGIISLKGIEYCTSLEKLNLSFNSIRDLSPLADLILLKELYLGMNYISENTQFYGKQYQC